MKLEIVEGPEGQSISLNGYRVAGPKPWGGGRVVKVWNAETEHLERALYGALAPPVEAAVVLERLRPLFEERAGAWGRTPGHVEPEEITLSATFPVAALRAALDRDALGWRPMESPSRDDREPPESRDGDPVERPSSVDAQRTAPVVDLDLLEALKASLKARGGDQHHE